MRHSLGLISSILLFSSHSFAQIEGLDVEDDSEEAPKKEAESDRPSSAYDENDIAYKEKSDPGPFAPKSKKAKEEQQAAKGEGPLSSTRFSPRKPVNLGADVLVGVGRVPIPGPAGTYTNSASGVAVAVGGTYDVGPKLSLGLVIPWATSGVHSPENPGASQNVLGAPQLLGQYRTRVARLTDLTAFIGIGLPLGGGDLDPTNSDTKKAEQGQAARFADGSWGYRYGEYFLPKTVPVVPGLRIAMYRGKLEAHGSTKISVAFNQGKVEIPNRDTEGKFEKRSVAFRSVTELGATYEIVEKGLFFAGLDAWMALMISEPIEFSSNIDAQGPSPVQLGVEPRVGTTLGPVTPTLGYLLPVGGRLGDSGIGTLHIAAAAAF